MADAVLNSLTCQIDESIVMMYFDFIDKYTLWHLKILDFFFNPKKFNGISESEFCMGSPMEPLIFIYPELKSNPQIVDKIIKDLYTDGLMNTENIRGMMSSSGMVASRTTDLGKTFLGFITTTQI